MAKLAQVFQALNSLEQTDIVEKYAIAGEMAFLFYTEPARSYDLDVLVLLPAQTGMATLLEPLNSNLRKRGYKVGADHVVINETPVAFFPAITPLAAESVEQAVPRIYDDVPVRVVSPEHLMALSYQTGKRERLMRADALLDEGNIDFAKLEDIMDRHGVTR